MKETKQDESCIESHFSLVPQGIAGEHSPELFQQEAKKLGCDIPAPADSLSCGPPQEEVNSQHFWVSVCEHARAQAKGLWEPQGGWRDNCSTGF